MKGSLWELLWGTNW